MLGKPSVVAVAPSRTPRLKTTGNAPNSPSAFSSAKSLAASTFTTLAEMMPDSVSSRTCVPSPATCLLVTKHPSSVIINPVPEDFGRVFAIAMPDLSRPDRRHLAWLEITRQLLPLRNLV